MTTEREPLWGEDISIPVLGVTGEINSGKTLFLLEIKPDRTRYYGYESSAVTYSRHAGLKSMVEVHEKMNELYSGDEYSPKQMWKWFEEDALSLPHGEYDVIAIDTIGSLEDGLPAHVASLYKNYGYSSEEAFTKTMGLFWSTVKGYLEKFINRLIQKTGIQTLAFAAHQKQEWVNGRPATTRVAEGKTTWNKLATFYLKLERPIILTGENQGKRVEKPNATVLKGRLSIPQKDTEGNVVRDEYGDANWVRVHPDKFADCTPGKIRFYIKNPVANRKLNANERVVEKKLTADEKLLIQSETERDRLATAELQANEKVERLAIAKNAAANTGPQKPATSATNDDTQALKPNDRELLTLSIRDGFKTLGMTAELAKKTIVKRGVETLSEMTDEQLRELASSIERKNMERISAAEK